MLKKVNLLGTEIDNYTAHEALERVESFLDEKRLDTVATVTTRLLRSAQTNAAVRKYLEEASLTIIGEEEILQALGCDTVERRTETLEHFFFREFMKRIERNHKAIFLLSDEREQLSEFLMYGAEHFPRLIFEGRLALEENGGDWDGAVNEINASSADVVLSLMRSPVQEEFLVRNRKRINARIWYGIMPRDIVPEGKGSLSERINRQIRGFILKRQARRYSMENHYR
jgi:N-acetylglucosaminyldiphosphoundecaprenol N-acetyl-beta-D-mannosaminyltransferase